MSVARGIRNACLPSLVLWALIALAVLSLVSCDEPETGGSILVPPERYQADRTSAVMFANRFQIEAICAEKLDHYAAACADINASRIWIENPCYVADQHWYPALLCHELAHNNGWPAGHPR